MARARRPRSAPTSLRRAIAIATIAFAGAGATLPTGALASRAQSTTATNGAGAPAIRAQAGGPQGRIVGGTAVSIGSVPWQVSVWSRGGDDGGFDCGGSILSPTLIVTAAHCVDGVDVGEDPEAGGLGVTAGVSHLLVDQPGDNFQDSMVESARIHPQWTSAYVRTAGDLAVLTIDPPLVLDGITAKAIALPPDEPIGDQPLFVGTTTLVSGFGRQSSANQPTGELFSLETFVDRPTVCPADDNATALCVRTPVGAACSGDSGGPLVTRTTPPVLIGVVSNGPMGCPPGEGESYVNLAVPENRRFLAGSSTPPIAPRQTAPLTFGAAGGPPLVGQQIVCSAGFSGTPTTRWTIKSDTGATVATSTTGGSLAYRPTDADAGHELSCEVTAANAGGVALAGPVSTGRVLRPRGQDPARTPPTPQPFRLGEAVLTAAAARTVKRGKLLRIDVAVTGLFSAAESGTVCVKQGTGKPKCLTPNVKLQAGAKLAFRFRISKRAKVKSLQTFAVTATLAGRNPNSGLTEQVNRSTSVRARVKR